MKNKLWFFILSFITIGCSEKVVYLTGPTTTKTDTVIVNAGMQTINLRVDWNKLNQIGSAINDGMVYAISDSALNITHIGSRLVYPKNNASFTQSVVRDTTGSTSLITLQVPATDTAHLYVVAVHEANGVRKALKMGVKRNIRILANSPINLTLDSLTLITTDWSVTDTNVNIVNDTIRLTTNDTLSKVVNIRMTDPYQINQTPNYANTIVKFLGSGYDYGNTDGWRKLGIMIHNMSTPVTVNKFWPYIDGSLFNLNGNYLIGKEGIIKTTWQ